jgi:hypothetical protein
METIRHGMRALYAVFRAEKPWVAIMVRGAFGVAGAGHGKTTGLNFRYAWPWGSLPVEGGIEAACKRDLEPTPSILKDCGTDGRIASMPFAHRCARWRCSVSRRSSIHPPTADAGPRDRADLAWTSLAHDAPIAGTVVYVN